MRTHHHSLQLIRSNAFRSYAYRQHTQAGGRSTRQRAARTQEEQHANVRAEHIDHTDGGFTVTVGGRHPKQIHVREDCCDLLAAAHPHGFRGWLFSPDMRTATRERSVHHFIANDPFAPRLPRLRAGWIVDLMNRRPAIDVIQAAGFESAPSLKPYEPFVTRRSLAELAPHLRSAPERES